MNLPEQNKRLNCSVGGVTTSDEEKKTENVICVLSAVKNTGYSPVIVHIKAFSNYATPRFSES